jgi:hypothetical protein
MTGDKTIGTQIARNRKQIGEFRPHVAADARDGSTPSQILISKLFYHRLAKGAFMVDDMMSKAQTIGNGRCITNVLTSAAGPFSAHCFAMIVKAKRYTDHFRTTF